MTWGLLVLLLGAGIGLSLAFSTRSLPGLGPPRRGLLVLPLIEQQEAPSAMAGWLAEQIEGELAFEVEIADPLKLPTTALNTKRGQYDAVALAQMLAREARQERAVLGILEFDLFSPERTDLPFALGARYGLAGVISVFRMAEGQPEKAPERLKKMALRYAGEMCCEVGRSSDPTSLVYNRLKDPQQLDLMEFRF